MPHVSVEYSANMEDRADMSGLCEALRKAVIETGIAPLAGVRVRAFKADHVSIADGDQRHGFVDIHMRLRAGRTLEARQSATKVIFAAAEEFLAEAIKTHSVALSFEMRDIDPELSPKTGSIRDHIGRSEP